MKNPIKTTKKDGSKPSTNPLPHVTASRYNSKKGDMISIETFDKVFCEARQTLRGKSSMNDSILMNEGKVFNEASISIKLTVKSGDKRCSVLMKQ